jgi:hypothetical protein
MCYFIDLGLESCGKNRRLWVTTRWRVSSKVLAISLSGLFASEFGPTSNVDRRLLWEWDLPWCIGSDFNVTHFPRERSGVAGFFPIMEEFLDGRAILECGCVEDDSFMSYVVFME